MKESPLMIKSRAFALEVIKVCKELRAAKCESALINQFLRSGTSIGANVREAFLLTVQPISWQSCKLLLKNVLKVSTGANCSWKADIIVTIPC